MIITKTAFRMFLGDRTDREDYFIKKKISNCYPHSNSLSNKMDNFLLAVRRINYKYK